MSGNSPQWMLATIASRALMPRAILMELLPVRLVLRHGHDAKNFRMKCSLSE